MFYATTATIKISVRINIFKQMYKNQKCNNVKITY